MLRQSGDEEEWATATEVACERKRLEVLDSYKILDTSPEQEYDDLATIAAAICDAPIAMVNFVGASQVFFKSRIGLPPTLERYEFDSAQSKGASFCVALVASQNASLEVPDSLIEKRWFYSSFVNTPKPARFYSGAAVVAPTGERVGTICVIDYKVRVLSNNQRKALQLLARQVTLLLELRRKNLDLASKNNELADLNAEKNAFLGMLSHDLRQPLCAIQVCSELLLRDDTNAESTELLECVFASSDLMLQLTNRLLRITKASSVAEATSLSHHENRPTLIARLVNRVVAANARLALRKNIDVALETPADGAQFLERMQVAIDSTTLEQVLNNIIGNAIKFSLSGTRVLVSLSSESNKTEALITVADRGPGIPADEHALLFKPYRSGSVKPSGDEKSTGLGLYVSKTLLQRFGASVRFESEPGKGTTFFITLPLFRDDAGMSELPLLLEPAASRPSPEQAGQVQRPHKRQREAADLQKRKLRVLVADDDPLNRRILISLFGRHGHTCVAMENGRLAVDKYVADKESFDVILLDVLMPVMDGIDASKIIKAHNPNAPIFLISGTDVEDLKRLCAEHQLSGYFWKPFSSKIVDEVTRVCFPQ